MHHLASDLPAILLHSDSLQAALMNLVKNAIEAMPQGGQLWARTTSTIDGVAMELIDTGCGVDDTTLMHIFEPFYSTKEEGSGLGFTDRAQVHRSPRRPNQRPKRSRPGHEVCPRIPRSPATCVGLRDRFVSRSLPG